jgi:asparagine synthase (glutamine-hydrolysing)
VQFEGLWGELTVTGMLPLATPRYVMKQFARKLLRRPDSSASIPRLSIVRLAQHRLISLSDRVNAAMRTEPSSMVEAARPSAPWRFPLGRQMRTGPSTELRAGELRGEYIFRDMRLWRLFARFPARFLVHEELDRAPARLMLKGRVPEHIRLQKKGLPFSPDYGVRIRSMAPEARNRIALFRRADIDDLLDLDWLEAGLARMATTGPSSLEDTLQVQLTAVAAEFLLWWRDGG